MTGLAHRSRKILFAAVTEHIASGRPVGSRTLARRYGLDLSPATIRNALADLEELGYLTQPHTSAGRVPTAKAMRAFITALNDFDEIPVQQRQAMSERVEEIYSGDSGDSGSRLHETGRLLSELSGAAAVISAPPADARKLMQLRFIGTKPGQLLAVLVFSDGLVENRYISIDEALVEPELTRIHNLLNDVAEGRSLGAVLDLLERRLADDRVQLDALRKRAFELAQQALESVARGPDSLVIEGSARLVELPEYEDVERLKGLVRTLGDREKLVQLLGKTMGAGPVSVFIGDENGELGGDISLIVAPFGDAEDGTGSVGVLGPTRMDYRKLMPLVGATAEAITEALKKSR